MNFRQLVIFTCLLLALAPGTVAQPSVAPLEMVQKPDVRVLIDISGSMKENDPYNLRRPALDLLVQLFPAGAKAGVWTFGQWVNNLVPSKPVDEQWRKFASSMAGKINSIALRTNIPEALTKAMDDLDNLDPAYQVHLILLTDGMVDVSKSPADNAAARQRITEVILPALRDKGVIIHTVALSNNADQELMEQLAVETGGLAAVAQTADDLTRIFLQAFDAAAPAEQVPLEGNSFLVDGSIDEFTALIFTQPGSQAVTLHAPDAASYSQQSPGKAKWFQQQNYNLITIKNPAAGEWRLDAELEPDSRITIVSNLSLAVSSLRKSHFVGESASVEAVLSEQGEVIARPEFLNLVDVSVDVVRRDDDQQWPLSLSDFNPIPEDGRFLGELDMFAEEGIYDITVFANAKTFQRQHKQTIAVRKAFDIRTASTRSAIPDHSVSLFARNAAVNGDLTTVTADVILPDGSEQRVAVDMTGNRRWRLALDGIDQPGYYQTIFNVEGQYQDGKAFSYTSELINIEHPIAGAAMPNKPAPVVEPAKPEPEPQPQPEPKSQAAPEPIEENVEQVEEELDEEQGLDLAKIGLYAGIALGNLLVLLLGYLAYRAVSASPSQSGILEDNDEVGDEELAEDEPEDDVDDDEELLDDDLDGEPVAQEPEQEPEPEELDLPDEEPVAENDTEEDIDLDMGDELDLDTEDSTEEADLGEVADEPALEEEEDLDDLDDILDLPDDAIDIDPASDDEQKK